jgi:hypothetical protein
MAVIGRRILSLFALAHHIRHDFAAGSLSKVENVGKLAQTVHVKPDMISLGEAIQIDVVEPKEKRKEKRKEKKKREGNGRGLPKHVFRDKAAHSGHAAQTPLRSLNLNTIGS